MMRLNMGLKSALLALTVMVVAPVATIRTQEAPIAITSTIMSFVKDHKVAFIAAAAWYIIDTRLNTRTKESFKMDDLQQDFKDLLDSLNIFDAKLYKQLVFMFDKYVIGLPIKVYEATIPKEKDGACIRVKGKYLDQKPFGAYGLFDAYVIKPSKKFVTETFVGVALLYAYFRYPHLTWGGAVNTAGKTLNITVNA